MVLSSEERSALNKKLENPKLLIKCPRCGAAIECHKYPSAIKVNCQTKGCIEKSIRGI